jgi:hypothetical protein
MSVLLVIVIFAAIIGGHGALINHCTSSLPSLYIVPQRGSLETSDGNILDEQLRPILIIEKVKGLSKGTTSIYLKISATKILYQIIVMQPSPPRAHRQVIIKSSTDPLPLFIGSEGPKGNPSFAIRVGSQNGHFLVVRCVDKLLYRYQIEDEFTRTIEAHVFRMIVPSPNSNSYTISFRSPIQKNKHLIAAIAVAMDELLM